MYPLKRVTPKSPSPLPPSFLLLCFLQGKKEGVRALGFIHYVARKRAKKASFVTNRWMDRWLLGKGMQLKEEGWMAAVAKTK